MRSRSVEIEKGVEFEVSIANEGSKITLKKGSEELVDFKQFTPSGTKFIFNPKGQWGAWIGGEQPKMEIGKFKGAGTILGFLHEAGHLHNAQDADILRSVHERYKREKKKDKKNSYTPERLKALAEERRRVIRSERDAWAFALRKTREIERRFGIKIFDNLPEVAVATKKNRPRTEGIYRFVDKFLTNYELGFAGELDLEDVYTKEEVERFFEDLEKTMPKAETADTQARKVL